MTQKNRQDQLFTGTTEFDGAVQIDGDLTVSGAQTVTGAVVRAGQELFIPAFNGKAGATAGWAVTGANDGLARLPASQTSSTLVIPITGLHVGETLTGVRAIGQVESAGGAVTLVMSVRKSTAAAADFTDAELDTANVGSLVADTLISAAILEVTALTEVLSELELLYVLLTGTTAAVTDIALSGLVATITKN